MSNRVYNLIYDSVKFGLKMSLQNSVWKYNHVNEYIYSEISAGRKKFDKYTEIWYYNFY